MTKAFRVKKVRTVGPGAHVDVRLGVVAGRDIWRPGQIIHKHFPPGEDPGCTYWWVRLEDGHEWWYREGEIRVFA